MCLCISMCVHPIPGQCTTDEQDSLCVRSLLGFNPHLGGSRCKNRSMPFGLRAGGRLLPPWPPWSEAAVVHAAFSFAVWRINRSAAAYIFFQGSPAITPAACAMHSESRCLGSLCDAVDGRPTRAEVKTAPRGASAVCLPLVFTAIVGSTSCGKLENFQSIKVDENHSSTTLGLCSSGCFSDGQTYF